MTISDRANQIEPSITMAVTALANKLKAEGKNILSFSAGEPDFDTPELVKAAAVEALKAGKTKYTPASGITELKQAVCKKLKEDQQLDYRPEHIVISCGAKHSIYNVFLAVLNPGDEVIIPTPYWVSYPYQVRMCGGVPVMLETTDEAGFKVTPAQLKAAITSKTKVFVLNSPSNPTGAVYTKKELEDLANILLQHEIIVISDEIYEKLTYDLPHVSIASLGAKIKDRTVVVNGVSKAYSMTGWRIGYTASTRELAEAMDNLQSHATSNPTSIAQWASLEALRKAEPDVQAMKKEFDARRKVMIKGLNRIPGLTCLEPQGAFYAFPKITAFFGKKAGSKTITSSVDFCQYLLEDTLVACVPGSGFGADDYIRLSYAASMNAITEGLQRIDKWINSLR